MGKRAVLGVLVAVLAVLGAVPLVAWGGEPDYVYYEYEAGERVKLGDQVGHPRVRVYRTEEACERGIRSFDPATRFTLDLTAVPLVKELSHLPIIVDPSHGTGRRSLVARMALAGLAAGADGLIIEARPEPDSAKCDATQTITPALPRA